MAKVLRDIPEPNMGAPIPMVVSGEHATSICYYLEEFDPEWDGTTIRMVGENTKDLNIAIIRFIGVQQHRFGPPDENGQSDHPLRPKPKNEDDYIYAFETQKSPWIYRNDHGNEHRHYVIFFHDSTFEVLASGYEVTIFEQKSVLDGCKFEIDNWVDG